MVIRVASYFGKIELENFFNASFSDYELPEPHFNLRAGHKLVAVSKARSTKDLTISEYRWGEESDSPGSTVNALGEVASVKEMLSRSGVSTCVVPVSGFYMWKNGDVKDQPFFVRMMNLPFMPVAAIIRNGVIQLILTKANTLIEPMSGVMPLVLNDGLAREWLQKATKLTELAEKAGKSFFITDFTVLKVSKKVSNPENNTPALIQPLPK